MYGHQGRKPSLAFQAIRNSMNDVDQLAVAFTMTWRTLRQQSESEIPG